MPLTYIHQGASGFVGVYGVGDTQSSDTGAPVTSQISDTYYGGPWPDHYVPGIYGSATGTASLAGSSAVAVASWDVPDPAVYAVYNNRGAAAGGTIQTTDQMTFNAPGVAAGTYIDLHVVFSVIGSETCASPSGNGCVYVPGGIIQPVFGGNLNNSVFLAQVSAGPPYLQAASGDITASLAAPDGDFTLTGVYDIMVVAGDTYNLVDNTQYYTTINAPRSGNTTYQGIATMDISSINVVITSPTDGLTVSSLSGNTYSAAETGVPEPASVAALLTGLLALAGVHRRRVAQRRIDYSVAGE